jgi:hypothetical protein
MVAPTKFRRTTSLQSLHHRHQSIPDRKCGCPQRAFQMKNLFVRKIKKITDAGKIKIRIHKNTRRGLWQGSHAESQVATWLPCKGSHPQDGSPSAKEKVGSTTLVTLAAALVTCPDQEMRAPQKSTAARPSAAVVHDMPIKQRILVKTLLRNSSVFTETASVDACRIRQPMTRNRCGTARSER